jgi:transposase
MEIATKRVDRQRLRELQPGVLRVRSDGKRIYAEDFKADLVRQCLVPGTSVAATGLAHGINANLLRRWIVLQSARGGSTATPPALLPVTVRAQSRASSPVLSASRTPTVPECIEIEFHGARIRLHGQVDAQRLGVVLDVLAQRT